ncbi:hypothetical protein [Moraxella bovis]|uniref:hypothetical protein n=1 Tax=Moraxella bovis TaxID=476 RepID=UPI000992FDA6|nr:hypothetical protein [Moraxella bovis]OOR90547.1 hypothetical protein B0182_04955 [Moraxella bovis]
MANTPFKLLGLTQDHKDFLHRYAQNELGTSSRTKAILAIIDKAMDIERLTSQDDFGNQNSKDELRKQAIENKKNQISQHQEKIENHTKEINQAKLQNNQELLKILSRKKLAIKKKRLQLSIPIYDYEYLEKLAKNSNSSIQYYITVVIIHHLYNEKRLLGNEIEILKKSNYELYKIGVNVNQIAKANNAGNMIELPINQLYKKIQEHIGIVQSLLKTSTGIY